MTDCDLRWAAIPHDTLNISATLASGQAFRWSVDNKGEWRGVVGSCVVRILPNVDGFWWQTYPKQDQWNVLEAYFALDVDLERHMAHWSERSSRARAACVKYRGLRILRQEPNEVFFSFLCASCNIVQKIRRSVSTLGSEYGELICRLDDDAFYRFPHASEIAEADEMVLRRALWGFRAPRVIAAAKRLRDVGDDWWVRVQNMNYEHAIQELTSFHGIGRKIADCILLFGFGFDQVVPVDTHILQLAVELEELTPHVRGKSLTPRVYNEIAESYARTFGPFAGWAQQYLFFDELTDGAALNTK